MLGVFVLYLAQPASYRIDRTRTLTAPPARIAMFVTDLRTFESWDPWPSTTGVPPSISYSAVSAGVGAWVERRDADGIGARTAIVSITPERIEMDNVTFGGPFGGGSSHQTFELRASGTGTELTWALSGELHGLARLLWPFVHLETSVHRSMDEALSRLDRASSP